jgi:hypothetical protein
MQDYEFRDNRPELKRRLAEDYNLSPEDAVVDAMLDAVVISVDRGYSELEPIFAKYEDLICPWCGHLHYRKECIERLKECDGKKQE